MSYLSGRWMGACASARRMGLTLLSMRTAATMTSSNSFGLFGLPRRDVVAGRRDADILFEILLSERSTRKLVGGGRHPQHRWWAPHAATLVRMVSRGRTMEAVNGARDHLRYLGPSHVGDVQAVGY